VLTKPAQLIHLLPKQQACRDKLPGQHVSIIVDASQELTGRPAMMSLMSACVRLLDTAFKASAATCAASRPKLLVLKRTCSAAQRSTAQHSTAQHTTTHRIKAQRSTAAIVSNRMCCPANDHAPAEQLSQQAIHLQADAVLDL
jgi:hypothetical protein